MRKILVLVSVMFIASAGAAAAQTGAGHPGFYPIEDLGVFDDGKMEVDIDLSGAMLQVAAGAMENQDESLAELVANLERVRVQVGAPSNGDAAVIGQSIASAGTSLISSGWNKILAVEEDDEQVYLYSLEQGGNIVGLTVLVNDGGDEVVLVNIAGSIDPRTLGRLISNIENFDIEEIMGAIEQ